MNEEFRREIEEANKGTEPRYVEIVCGEAIYAKRCVGCHGEDGSGGSSSDITGAAGGATLVNVLLDGVGSMPGFADSLNDQEVADLAAFVETEIYQ